MDVLKWLFLAAFLVSAIPVLGADPALRFAVARALAAGAPEVSAPNFDGGVSLVTVAAGGAIEVLD